MTTIDLANDEFERVFSSIFGGSDIHTHLIVALIVAIAMHATVYAIANLRGGPVLARTCARDVAIGSLCALSVIGFLGAFFFLGRGFLYAFFGDPSDFVKPSNETQ